MLAERHFGLIGKPLDHSFSRQFFTEKFRKLGLPHCRYENYPIASVALMPTLFKSDPFLEGLNVTVPYKEQVIPYLDELDESARQVGAVNCIRRVGAKLIGFNTDVFGFAEAVQPLLKPWHRAALILGSGGAAKAVATALRHFNISYQVVSRTAGEHVITYADLNVPLMHHYLLIINTTPLGMYPDVHSMPPIPVHGLTPQHLVFDLIYNPQITRLMSEAIRVGAAVCNGWNMLVLQAEKSWEIWNQSFQG
ncbi:MAG: shikimate dehydrogenase [Chitinophagales bacterium]|nr:shikimate dehydrogenase [Chitinophagales bacterium]MDW8428523.1 shikimate dehydrogenase [Chitinophagales bacterium]